MRDGARLLWRVSTGWMLVWFGIAVACLYTFGTSPAFLLIAALSAPAFDMHVLMLDRAARNRNHAGDAFLEAWSMLVARRMVYLRSAITRIVWSLVIVGVYVTILLALVKLAGKPPEASTPQTSPPWLTLFGINWLQWGWIGILPAAWQRGGIISFRPWLVRRLGADEAIASQLQSLARRRNPSDLLSLMFYLIGIGCLSITFAPFLLPIFDVYFAAVMRCAYHDIFEGGTKIESPVVAPSGALIPA